MVGRMEYQANGFLISFDLMWRFSCRLPTYEVKDNTVLVKCTVGNNLRIVLRCKIWPTPKNFGLNKIEATLNGAFLWKKGLWWYNAKSSREFTIDDEIKLIAEWHVTLRTPAMLSKHPLPPHDPRRSQGPFCVDYLALKGEDGRVLIEYLGDKSPLLEAPVRLATLVRLIPFNEFQPLLLYHASGFFNSQLLDPDLFCVNSVSQLLI